MRTLETATSLCCDRASCAILLSSTSVITTVTLPGVAVAAGFTVGFLGSEVAVAAFVGAGVGVSVGSGVGVGVLVGNGVGVSVGSVVTVGVKVANSTSAEETSAGVGVITVQEDQSQCQGKQCEQQQVLYRYLRLIV